MAYEAGGLRIVNVSNSANPAELGVYTTTHEVKSVYAVNNNTAYIIDEGDGPYIINVTNPSSPSLIGVENFGGEDIHVAGNKAYVVQRGGDLLAVDISNPSNPSFVWHYNALAENILGVYVVDDKAYVGHAGWNGGGMHILDVANPATPTILGSFTDFGVKQIVVSSTIAHIANEDFHSIDVSNSANPTALGFLDGDPGSIEGVAAGNKVYVSNDDLGLQIIDVSTPMSPTMLGSYDTSGSAEDVFVSGSRAYIADANKGLRIIDVANPASPVELGFYDAVSETLGVYVAGNTAYMADDSSDDSGLLILDVSNPSNPTRLGAYPVPAADVYVVGNNAYIIEWDTGLYVIDVSDPTAPTQVGYFYLDSCQDVYAAGNIAYVSCSYRGLYILRFTGVPPTFSASGQVTDTSNPVSGVTISTNKGQQTATNSSGVFTLTNLVEGDYTFTPYRSGYTFSPVTRSVTISPNVTGQDFTATPIVTTGTITGQVTTSGSTPLPGIIVAAYQNQGGTWFSVDSTTTSTGGNYTLSLPVGTYRLYFADSAQNYRNEYYDNQTDLNNGTDVTVTANVTTSNINADLEATPPPLIEVSGQASTSLDRQTGEVTIRGSRSGSNQVTIKRTITCNSGNPTNVNLMVGSKSFVMTAGSNNQYSVTLNVPDDLPDGANSAGLSIQYSCDESVSIQVGQIVLFDPSGQVTNESGQPVEGATVSLYRVSGALPDKGGQTNDCKTVNTRPGGVNGDWSGVPAASIDTGIWINPDLFTMGGTAEISPTINPQVTGSDGRYAWDTVEGCWYVVIEANGYETKISPLVGIPPEVTDLDIKLSSDGVSVYLPIILKMN